jgi:transcriptional regulator of aromatic amino acid metabolism
MPAYGARSGPRKIRRKIAAIEQRRLLPVIYNSFLITLHGSIPDYVTENAIGRRASEHLIDGDLRMGDERLIGGDTGLAAVMARATGVTSSAPVLLFGETGTGKEIIARAIHEHRPSAPAVPPRELRRDLPELIDSEPFGHERGAFTSAHTPQGWFEQADGGTSSSTKWPSSRPPRRCVCSASRRTARPCVGGERPVRVHVRIVAATHRDLPGMVEHRRFANLYYRLSVFPIIPPLRTARRHPRLRRYFAERAANRFGLRAVPISTDDVRVLAGIDGRERREMAAVMTPSCSGKARVGGSRPRSGRADRKPTVRARRW